MVIAPATSRVLLKQKEDWKDQEKIEGLNGNSKSILEKQICGAQLLAELCVLQGQRREGWVHSSVGGVGVGVGELVS